MSQSLIMRDRSIEFTETEPHSGAEKVLSSSASQMLFRHQCEVRFALRLRLRDRAKSEEYLGLVEKRRGRDAMLTIKGDVGMQIARGNVGRNGEWIGE